MGSSLTPQKGRTEAEPALWHGQSRTILGSTVKLMEELGELCDDVLGHSGLQRTEKLKSLEKENIAEEFAGVVITTYLLAKAMDIDIEAGLERKMEKIMKRVY